MSNRMESRGELARGDLGPGSAWTELDEARREIAALQVLIARLGSDVRASGPAEIAEARRLAEEARREAEAARQQAVEMDRARAELQAKLERVLASRSWRLTRVLRVISRLIRGDSAPLMNALRQRRKG